MKPRTIWLLGLLCGGMAMLAPGPAAALGILLAPAWLALVLDHRPHRPVARCTILLTLAAGLAPLRLLWFSWLANAGGIPLPGLGQLGTVWSAAAAGWLLAEMLPVLVRAVLEMNSAAHAARLRFARDQLTDAWSVGAPRGAAGDETVE